MSAHNSSLTTTAEGLARRATMQDVARAVGVTPMTVSYVLSGKRKVSDATREAVLKAAQELNFSLNPHAQRLRVGRSERMVGFFNLDIDLGVGTRKLQVIQEKLSRLGYSVPIYAHGYNASEEERAELMSALVAQGPRAIVCNTLGVPEAAVDELDRYIQQGGTVVCYSYGKGLPLDCDQVQLDNDQLTHDSARHMLELGHRKLGYFNVGGNEPSNPHFQGFVRALKEFSVPLRDEWVFKRDGTLHFEENGMLLARQFLALKERPTGICIVNDYAALAFVSEVTRAGVKVPDNLSVVGSNDSPIAPHCVVPLTTMSHPVESIASRVVSLLQDRLEMGHVGPGRTIVLCGALVRRESTAPHNSHH